MSFADALAQNPAPDRLGDVRFRSDPPVLMGETAPDLRFRRLAGLLWFCALLLAAGAVGALLVRPDGALPYVLGMGCAAISMGAAVTERRGRARRRFVLHFGTETLRIEAPVRWTSRVVVRTVPFDDVRNVFVARGQRMSLYVEYALGERLGAAMLIDRIREDEAEALARVWRALRSAFALPEPDLKD